AAVAVLRGDEQVFAVGRAIEEILRDAWEVLAEHVSILGRIGAKLVVMHLLIGIEVFLGPFRAARITRVIKAGVLRVPDRVAARRRQADPRYGIGQFLTGGDFEDIE